MYFKLFIAFGLLAAVCSAPAPTENQTPTAERRFWLDWFHEEPRAERKPVAVVVPETTVQEIIFPEYDYDPTYFPVEYGYDPRMYGYPYEQYFPDPFGYYRHPIMYNNVLRRRRDERMRRGKRLY